MTPLKMPRIYEYWPVAKALLLGRKVRVILEYEDPNIKPKPEAERTKAEKQTEKKDLTNDLVAILTSRNFKMTRKEALILAEEAMTRNPETLEDALRLALHKEGGE